MIQYEIKPDKDDIAEAIALFEFVGGNTSNAVRVAINKAGGPIRQKSQVKIREQVRLKASYVKGKLVFKRASTGNLVGKIQAESRGLLLSRFSTDAQISGDKVSWIKPPPIPARGIKVKVKPDGSAKTVDGDEETTGLPFYMVLKGSGRVAIAARKASAGPQGGKIKVFYGPSVSQVFTDVKDEVQPEAQQIYTKELIDAMRYVLTKRYPVE